MIDTNKIPLVSCDEMDSVHLEEVQMLNQLYKLLNSNEKNETKIILALNELLLHVREHFSKEERLMKDSYYPMLNMHKSEHTKIVNEMQINTFMFRNTKDYTALKEYFLTDIPTWLNQHIMSMDITFANYLSQKNPDNT